VSLHPFSFALSLIQIVSLIFFIFSIRANESLNFIRENKIFSKSTTADYSSYVTISPNSVSTTDKYVTSASSVTGHVFNTLNANPTKTSLSDHIPRVTTKYPSSTRSQFIPTMVPVNEIVTTATPTTFSHHTTNSYVHFSKYPTEASSTLRVSPSSSNIVQSSLQNENTVYEGHFERTTALSPTEEAARAQASHENLSMLLRREGLFAMAKYLRQSGLDNVLNETGELSLQIVNNIAGGLKF